MTENISGIYIPGIEMPKDKAVSLLILTNGNVYKDGICLAKKAIPVVGDGDLIDRDAAIGSIKPWSPEDERNCCTIGTVKKLMYTMLDRAPTVIPGSREEK